jgi:hypothetical protein
VEADTVLEHLKRDPSWGEQCESLAEPGSGQALMSSQKAKKGDKLLGV